MTESFEQFKTEIADRYEIQHEVGAGGMAVVYLAQDVRHDRLVALKVLRAELAVSIGADRFLMEIKIAAKLSHPHILPLYDSGEAAGFLYYVMPFVEGESLRDLLKRENQLSIDEAIKIGREVAEALSVAHSHGIIHRDIKPENIMLSGGHAVVTDFGIARAFTAAGGEGFTQTGMAIGTPAYMSPEQSGGDPNIDGRADIYSLGCVLYEMLIGQPPFDGPTAAAIMARHTMDHVPPMHIMRDTITEPLEALVMCALAKTPADRFRTSGDLVEALNAIATNSRPQIPTVVMQQRKRRKATITRWLVLAGAALLLVVAGAIGSQLLRPGGPPERATGGLDPRRVAVLYFGDQSRDGSLQHVADGITEGLIAQLNTVDALQIVSRNGVAQFRDAEIPRDSIARALNVGHMIDGDVEPIGSDLFVQVRLREGTSGTIVRRADIQLPAEELLAVLDSVVLEVSRQIRAEIGEEVIVRERRAASAEAWALVQRGAQLRDDAQGQTLNGDVEGALRTLSSADSMLALAELEDPDWVEPVVLKGWVAYQRARLNTDRSAALANLAVAIEQADRALALEPGEATAYELRGTSRFFSWFGHRPYDRDEADELFEAAKNDLQSSVEIDPTLASAHYVLSRLHRQEGDEFEAVISARTAYDQDSYLRFADAILSELFWGFYGMQDFNQGLDYCNEGMRRFPNDPEFSVCRLWLMTTEALEPEIDEAWRLAARIVELTPEQDREYESHAARVVVGGVIAKAGEVDSARSVLSDARPDRRIDPTRSLLYNEAYMRLLLDEQDEAYELLREFHAANPEEDHGEGEAGDVYWWWREIQHEPRFSTIFHGRR